MGFLDRFKPTPRWKHPDGTVRAAAVEALPDDDQTLLASIVFEDPDPAVRRAAVGKLTDAATLARVAREDADEVVRLEAREVAVGFARDAVDEAAGLEALGGLVDSRELAIVARGAELEAVALAALARLEEDRVIAVVARQASHAGVRLAALRRLGSREDLVAVAAKTEHKDVGLAALDRLTDRADLELVSVRGRNKQVARRARAALRAMEEAERVPLQEHARREALVADAEGLTRLPNLAAAAERLETLRTEWAPFEATATAEQQERFGRAVSQVQALLAQSEAERAEHERRAEAEARDAADAGSAREAVCARLEQVAGQEPAGVLDEARTLWAALAPWPPSYAESAEAREFDARFARALQGAERRMTQAAELEAQRGTLEGLLAEMRALVDRTDLGAARADAVRVRGRWQQAGGPHLDPALAAAFAELDGRLAAREQAAREARQRDAADHQARLEALAHHLELLVASPEASLKDLDRAVRDARAAIDHPGPSVSRPGAERVLHRLRQALTALAPRVAEVREVDEWRRWANATVQEELCKKAEALGEVQDPADVAKHLRELQQEWKKVAAGPKDQGEALWHRFKDACDQARARVDGHFAEQRAQWTENLQKKLALCEQAEALAQSTHWIETADTLKRLQGEWQQIGPVPQDQAKAVWERFRSACDTFFTRRKADLTERKHAWAENQKAKEAICERAEALAASTEWDRAAAELKQLQAQWKTVGPVKKTKSEALWKRFRAACDAFFERYKHRGQIEADGHAAEREALCVELETVAAGLEGGTDSREPEMVAQQVVDVWQRYQRAPRVPRQVHEAQEERLLAAVGRIVDPDPGRFRGTRLDPDAIAGRMEQLCAQVEDLVAGHVSAVDIASAPPEALASILKNALAANTIGGRVDEDAKRRAAVGTVRDAQNAWRRLGPLADERGRALSARFHRACKRFYDLVPGAQNAPRHTHA
jgi:hypothetical protein